MRNDCLHVWYCWLLKILVRSSFTRDVKWLRCRDLRMRHTDRITKFSGWKHLRTENDAVSNKLHLAEQSHPGSCNTERKEMANKIQHLPSLKDCVLFPLPEFGIKWAVIYPKFLLAENLGYGSVRSARSVWSWSGSHYDVTSRMVARSISKLSLLYKWSHFSLDSRILSTADSDW